MFLSLWPIGLGPEAGYYVCNGQLQVQVLWATGKETWEPVHVIWQDNPSSIAKYAKENNLLTKYRFKWCKQFLEKCNLRVKQNLGQVSATIRISKHAKREQLKQGQHFKFRVVIPKNSKKAYELDAENGDTK